MGQAYQCDGMDTVLCGSTALPEPDYGFSQSQSSRRKPGKQLKYRPPEISAETQMRDGNSDNSDDEHRAGSESELKRCMLAAGLG